MSSPSPTAIQSGSNQSVASLKNYKTRLCVFHAAGRCLHGSMCSYAHHPSELADPKTYQCPCNKGGCPHAHSVADLRALPQPKQKQSLCKYYIAGKCKAGTACRHAHSFPEMVVANAEQMQKGRTSSPAIRNPNPRPAVIPSIGVAVPFSHLVTLPPLIPPHINTDIEFLNAICASSVSPVCTPTLPSPNLKEATLEEDRACEEVDFSENEMKTLVSLLSDLAI